MNRHVKVIRNILALLINQVGTWTISFVLTLMVPPYLGVKLYGAYAFLITYTGLFSILIGLGTGTYLTWRIAREPEGASRLTVNTLALQVPLGIICAIACLVILPIIDRDPLLFRLAAILIVSTILSSLIATCVAALGGLQNMRIPAMIVLATMAMGAAGTVTCILLHQNILVIASTALVAQVLGAAIILAYTHRIIHLRPHIQPTLWPAIIKGGVPFFTWSAVLLLYGQIDIPMLKVMAGDNAVGWYSVALRVVSLPVFVPTIITTAVLPALSKEKSADSPYFRDLAARSIRIIAAVNIPACVGTMLLASSLLPLLHYPRSFDQAVPLMIILAVNLPLVALDMVLGTILISLGKQKAWTLVGVIAAVTNPIANLWAIPMTQHTYGNGAIGASLTTLLTEVIMLAGALYLCPRGLFSTWDLFYIVRCLAAAAVMLPAVWALSHQQGIGILPAVAYGMVIYALAAYTLQIVRNDDLKGVSRVVLNRLGFAGPADVQARIKGSLARAAQGPQTLRRAAARAGGAISRPLAAAYSGTRLPLAPQTAESAKPPVRFGPPLDAIREMGDGAQGQFATEPFQMRLPIGNGAVSIMRHASPDLGEFRETATTKRPGRRLPPAPSARRLRRPTSTST
jgi:O-antigen/teichoic acid export membrane protein